jgi:hypothetical protein
LFVGGGLILWLDFEARIERNFLMSVGLMAKPKAIEQKITDYSEDVRTAVLTALGKPVDLLKVTVANVYNNRYRVNVFRAVIEDSDRVHLTDSFFVIVDDDGEVFSFRPEIVRKYGVSKS